MTQDNFFLSSIIYLHIIIIIIGLSIVIISVQHLLTEQKELIGQKC